jgi:hypothetical protein
MNNRSIYFFILFHVIGSICEIREGNFQLFLPYSCAMSEDAVLAATRRKSGNNNQEKRAWKQQKNKTFCSDCDKFFCLDCFNNKHHAME